MPTPHSFRLYFASAPGDMDGERAVLDSLVLPELRGRLQKQGIEIVVVDPLNATGERWNLARRFQEIETCDLFIGLLGERYGEAPTTVPLSLVAAQPWLAEDPGRSVLELEVLQGALRTPGRASFFYFRNHRFPSMVPEEVRRRFLPENEEAVTRLESLKERIRSSGRPVFDGYPCGWSEGLGRASRLDTFAEQVFGDLWDAIQEHLLSTAEAVPASTPPEPAPPSPYVPPGPSFDPNATVLAFSSAPIRRPERIPESQLDETRASPSVPPPLPPAPPPLPPAVAAALPTVPPPMPSSPVSRRRGPRPGFAIAATVALAVIGLGLFALSRQTASRPASIPTSTEVPNHPVPTTKGPQLSYSMITPEIRERRAAACRLGPESTRALPTRATAGSPMVQVFVSADGIDAAHALSRYSSRHGFLLPMEENGHTVCTVVLGPFRSQEAASRAAAEIRISDGTDAKVVLYPGFTQ